MRAYFVTIDVRYLDDVIGGHWEIMTLNKGWQFLGPYVGEQDSEVLQAKAIDVIRDIDGLILKPEEFRLLFV